MFLPQRVEPGSSRTGWCALPGSLPLRCHRFPMIRSPSQCPGTLRSSTSSGRSTSADHPHELGGCAAPTRLMRPASGALRAQHDSCGRASSPCHEGIEPWCRRPRGTPTTPFDCWGSPCTDSLDCHHKPPPGVPATIWQGCPGTLQIRQHPGLEDPMRHRILRVFGLDRRFWAFTSAATRADTHTSRRCGVSLSRYHGHRSTRSDPQSAAASILPTIPLAIAARSCTVNIRRTNNPSPTSTVATTL